MSEFRLRPNLSVAALLSGYEQAPAVMVQKAAQANLYILGDFDHGLQLGSHLLFENGIDRAAHESSLISGLSMGIYGGYKAASHSGFTFTLQLGPMYTLPLATTEFKVRSGLRMLGVINIHLGWSF